MALPDVTLEVAFDHTYITDALVGGDWDDLSSRVMSFSMTRGRQDRSGAFEPGTLTVILDNSDGDLDPANDSSQTAIATVKSLLCPVRLKVDGTSLFTGVTGPDSCFRATYSTVGAASTVELRAVDMMGWHEQVRLPASLYAQVLTGQAPDWWIRGLGGDVAAEDGDSLQDWSGNDHASLIGAGVGDVMFWADSLIPGDTDRAMLPEAGVYGYTDATAIADTAMDDMTIAFVYKSNPTSGVSHWLVSQSDANDSGYQRWRMTWDYINEEVNMVAFHDSGGINKSTATVGVDLDDGNPHFICATINGGVSVSLRVDDDTDTTLDASIETGFEGRVQFGDTSSAHTAIFDEVAFWADLTKTVTGDDMDDLAGILLDNRLPFTQSVGNEDTLSERVERWYVDVAGYTGAEFTADVDVLAGTADPDMGGVNDAPDTLADALRVAAESFRGEYYTLRNGDTRVRSATAADNATHAALFVTEQANLTDEVSPAGSPTPIPRSPVRWSGVRSDRLINVSTVQWEGLVFSTRDDTSVGEYGIKERTWRSEVKDAFLAETLADADVARWKDPELTMEALTLYPSMDTDTYDFVVDDLELEVAVEVSWTPYGETVQSGTYNVQGERWDMDGTDWTVTLWLAEI